MGTVRKTMSLTDKQDGWIKSQIDAGHYTNDSEYIRDLIRHEQERNEETQAIRAVLTLAFGKLAESPKTAPACDPIRPGYRRRHVERHMIYFREATYGIDIIRIFARPNGSYSTPITTAQRQRQPDNR